LGKTYILQPFPSSIGKPISQLSLELAVNPFFPLRKKNPSPKRKQSHFSAVSKKVKGCGNQESGLFASLLSLEAA